MPEKSSPIVILSRLSESDLAIFAANVTLKFDYVIKALVNASNAWRRAADIAAAGNDRGCHG